MGMSYKFPYKESPYIVVPAVTSTQTASDRDQVKFSTLGKAQTGRFLCILW